ncbi:trp operon leader peptide [Enterobacter hormaechei]|uniref:trp operon leader peptide n=1 Tax=Enterobacter hormaechei TaxID=158836 RepID=A0ABD4JYP6_9ENTR|nr:trp operon leader peptide [Enterobacter hormaechei]MBS6387589.1 trp operon leader peptide [Enterobacter sp.]MBY0634208.1 trp operon leader peptide [Enterobacter sp. NIC22-4]UAS96748.1 trp operon leader peptide [Enterobacter cloacae complex sp.]HCM9494455.1 trp operon leader peptide [Enterobacter hormaechei subsp. hormaechei]
MTTHFALHGWWRTS